MIYVASPYSHPDKRVRRFRHRDISALYAYLMDKYDEVLISPVIMFHPIDLLMQEEGVTKDHEFWMKRCRELLRMCSKMFVIQLSGWEESKGVQEEIKIALQLGIPIEYHDPAPFFYEFD